MHKKILVVDDEENILISLKGGLEDEGYLVDVASSAEAFLDKFPVFLPDAVLLDIWMPHKDGLYLLPKIREMDPHVTIIMMSGHGSVETAVRTIKLGAFDFLEKPIHFDKLILLLKHAFELKKLSTENQFLKEELRQRQGLIGRSLGMENLRELVHIAGPSNGWVLIQGENGTGKELVAWALHQASHRQSKGAFVAVNCAAIPEDLIESELFGHEKGAFTGAFERRMGKFEQADGGTLFLDEVGDMSLKVQSKILRALEEMSFQRVGGRETLEVNVRVIAATNKDLKKAIEDKTFREDLFFRLNVIPVRVPPLRERKEDVPLLIEHYLSVFSGGKKKIVEASSWELLCQYSWPGNVRELKNWVERACILSRSDSIDAYVSDFLSEEHVTKHNFNPNLGKGINARSIDAWVTLSGASFKEARELFEKKYLTNVLKANDWNVTKTAQIIRMERSALHKKMKAYSIDVEGIT